MNITPMGDIAVVVEFGTSINEETQKQVIALSKQLEQQPFKGMIEYVPAFTTVTVFYNPLVILYHQVKEVLEGILVNLKAVEKEYTNVVKIPVCYGRMFGPDLEYVAKYNGLTPEEVIEIHTGNTYNVNMIGFAPGFPYMSGMSKKIATPRKETPNTKIPAGSVGIGGEQTGIYSIETPGGWQIIGRTPLPLFNPNGKEKFLLSAGDVIEFVPITEEEFEVIRRSQDER